MNNIRQPLANFLLSITDFSAGILPSDINEEISPLSNSAAPKSSGFVIGITTLSSLTKIFPSSYLIESISEAPPIMFNC